MTAFLLSSSSISIPPAGARDGPTRGEIPRPTSAVLNGLAAPSYLGRRHTEHAQESAAHVRRVGKSGAVRRLAKRRAPGESRARALELEPAQVGAQRDPHGL